MRSIRKRLYRRTEITLVSLTSKLKPGVEVSHLLEKRNGDRHGCSLEVSRMEEIKPLLYLQHEKPGIRVLFQENSFLESILCYYSPPLDLDGLICCWEASKAGETIQTFFVSVSESEPSR